MAMIKNNVEVARVILGENFPHQGITAETGEQVSKNEDIMYKLISFWEQFSLKLSDATRGTTCMGTMPNGQELFCEFTTGLGSLGRMWVTPNHNAGYGGYFPDGCTQMIVLGGSREGSQVGVTSFSYFYDDEGLFFSGNPDSLKNFGGYRYDQFRLDDISLLYGAGDEILHKIKPMIDLAHSAIIPN